MPHNTVVLCREFHPAKNKYTAYALAVEPSRFNLWGLFMKQQETKELEFFVVSEEYFIANRRKILDILKADTVNIEKGMPLSTLKDAGYAD